MEADRTSLHAPRGEGVERSVCVYVSHIPMSYKVSHHHQAVTPTYHSDVLAYFLRQVHGRPYTFMG